MIDIAETVKHLEEIRKRFITGASYAYHDKDLKTMKRLGEDAKAIKAAVSLLKPADPVALTLESLKHLPIGVILWCDYRERIAGKEPCLLPMAPVEFCGLGNETFEDTSVPEPVIYYSDGLDFQSEYAVDHILWTGKPTEEQRRALDLSVYRRAEGG